MERIEIMNPFAGIFGMIVCADKDCTDEEILAFCNRENPSGTSGGWSRVCRNGDEEGRGAALVCADNPDHLHIIVTC